jgi:hypothetical protein
MAWLGASVAWLVGALPAKREVHNSILSDHDLTHLFQLLSDPCSFGLKRSSDGEMG